LLALDTNVVSFRKHQRRNLLKVGSTSALSFPLLALLGLTPAAYARDEDFDHSHSALDALLRRHVSWIAGGTASVVNYKAIAADRAALKAVLDQYSAVSKAQYDNFKRDEKLAFLINVYNAFTIELILTKYPEIKSIKNIGGVFTKPWSIRFVKLLGQERHLDNVEHDMIRAPGVFDEPRVHFVVNCASIGCPALRPEAITAAKLEQQLEDSTRRFLRDRTRNKYNAKTDKLEVSKIFDWFKVDWVSGYKGYNTREQFFAKYAEVLAEDAAVVQQIKEGKIGLGFLEYDWALNDKK
jgi:hypothetical protein